MADEYTTGNSPPANFKPIPGASPPDNQEEATWDENDIIRTEMRKYLNHFLTVIAKMKKCVEEFEIR